ncbi:uncharacterized protein FOMMEDRAFT_171174 [Fomitiporia mediterranea MF3/22]|uniref:uncharacterized protein n=1 Tax=Fomitiporia mediterranea (strain MF3/22) TaxID=694068 RepID=UPI00044081CA|nr:uncharacterized protein FOMMEDRAFT_171174 [Fomitiporia mediterranea MF3/22]EJC98237.1 hypothetical protein FOMMEDRAFT_171174 [Fomitiporia mediterranea MF3/22]
MADIPAPDLLSQTAENKQSPLAPPPQHPDTSKMPGDYNTDSKQPAPSTEGPSSIVAAAGPSSSQTQPKPQTETSGFFKRALSKDNRRTAHRFFSAYAQTWVGMSPLWLMGEAILPGHKVGTQFNKGRKNLFGVAEEVRQVVTTSGKDVVVIIDEKLFGRGEGGKQVTERTAEVIKAAGENALLVVTTSLDKLSTQFTSTKSKASSQTQKFDLRELANDPKLKQSLRQHSRDALVLLDNALKHPVVVTGVSRFARSRGIPHADALLRLASLGLGRILRAMPEEVQQEVSEHVEAKIEEIDAEELERTSTQEERVEAENIGKTAEKAAVPKVEGSPPGDKDDPYATMKKKNECIIM